MRAPSVPERAGEASGGRGHELPSAFRDHHGLGGKLLLTPHSSCRSICATDMGQVRTKPTLAQRFLTLRGLVGLVWSGGDPESFAITEEGLQYGRANQCALDSLAVHPEVGAIIRERYRPAPYTIERLLQCPVGSLGHAFATWMTEKGLDPDFYRKMQVVDDTSYVVLRVRQTHDIWHVITGFDIDEIGEVSLQSFEMAQARSPVAAIIVAQFILKGVFFSPLTLPRLFDGIVTGYQMGKTTKPFLAQRWEDGWDKPLEVWRAEVGLRAGAVPGLSSGFTPPA